MRGGEKNNSGAPAGCLTRVAHRTTGAPEPVTPAPRSPKQPAYDAQGGLPGLLGTSFLGTIRGLIWSASRPAERSRT